MGPTRAHLGMKGPRWAPCWPHEPCYLGMYSLNSTEWALSPASNVAINLLKPYHAVQITTAYLKMWSTAPYFEPDKLTFMNDIGISTVMLIMANGYVKCNWATRNFKITQKCQQKYLFCLFRFLCVLFYLYLLCVFYIWYSLNQLHLTLLFCVYVSSAHVYVYISIK